MSEETSDLLLGVFIVILLVPALYLIARLATKVAEVWGSHVLAPLTATIDGTMHSGYISGTYQGCQVFVSFSPTYRVSAGDSFIQEINAFFIEVIHLKGEQDWLIRFAQTGFFNQGPIRLSIQAQDQVLYQRLKDSGVLAAVAVVSAPTKGYVTVKYEAIMQKLTFMDDVSPGKIPSLQKYNQQLALVAHLVEVNNQVNPPLSKPV